jgi:hypothetical protein
LDRKNRARLPRVRVYVNRTPAAEESSPTQRRLTETTHYTAGTPFCEQKVTVKNMAFLAMMRRSAVRV